MKSMEDGFSPLPKQEHLHSRDECLGNLTDRDDLARLRLVFDCSRDAIWTWSREATIIDWNPSAERLLGYSAREVIGTSILTLMPLERREEARARIQKILGGIALERFESQRLHKDGTIIPVEITASPLLDSNRFVSGAATFCRDISERSRIQASLGRRMRELTALYELTDRLQRTNSLNSLCDAALSAIIAALGCERSSILLFDEKNIMRFIAWRGLSDRYRTAVEGHSPWTPDDIDAAPICTSADDPALNQFQSVIRVEGIQTICFFPLQIEGRLIGKFMAYYDQDHCLSDEEMRLGLNIARQLAFSISKQRAEEQRQHSDALMRDSESRLALALSAGNMGAWEWSIAKGQITWSPSLERIHGLAPNTFGGTFEDFKKDIVPEDLPSVLRDIEASLASASDYHTEYRMRRPDGSIRWLEAHGTPTRDPSGRVLKLSGICMDVTERKLAENQKNLLINELNHRVKNTLATVQAIASQTLKGSALGAEVQRKLESRLIALSSAHSILTDCKWEGADIHPIVNRSLLPHGDQARFDVRGPSVQLSPKFAVAIAMGIHELVTNAVKYGALSTSTGRVDILWSVDEGNILKLIWKEIGGPPVSVPERRGFGSRLIERNLAQDLDGEACIEFAPDGIVCTILANLGSQ